MKGTVACWLHVVIAFTFTMECRMAQRAFPLVRSADDLDLLPHDGNRHELIDGVLFVTPAPHWVHQRALTQLAKRLLPFVEQVGLELFVAPTAVRASPFTEVEPDLVVVAPVPAEHKAVRWLSMRMLSLAVEILSPSTADRDRTLKRRTYLQHGVAEYWVVDLDERAIDVWRSDGEPVERQSKLLMWHPVASHAALTLNLADYFAAVLDG